MSYFARYRYNFCWPVRTLRVGDAEGRWQERTPAMSAGLADHIWSLEEWLSFPAVQRNQDTTGIIVRSPTIVQGLLGGFKAILGGRIGSYTQMCEQARQQAYDLMVEHAREMGANAVVGFRYDASEVVSKVGATEVLCYGTAVVIAPQSGYKVSPDIDEI
jgi:uncharacterized protein YbjQ (UPF0145 family)